MKTGPTVSNFSAVILAAGKSERMGKPKFLLKDDENKTFLEILAGTYSDFGCSEIVVVLNDYGLHIIEDQRLNLPAGTKLASNHHPEWERFYSLKTGVRVLESPKPVFVSNIDNPFACSELLHNLLQLVGQYDYLFPEFNGKGGHPFMISERVVNDITSETRDQIHLREFLGRYTSKAVRVNDEKVLVNINTREDYSSIFNSTG